MYAILLNYPSLFFLAINLKQLSDHIITIYLGCRKKLGHLALVKMSTNSVICMFYFFNIREISWTKMIFSAWKFNQNHMENLELHTRNFTKFFKQGALDNKYLSENLSKTEFSISQSQPLKLGEKIA